MVRVVTVEKGFEPPLHEKFATVDVVNAGDAYFNGYERLQPGTFRVNNDAPDIANAIDEAVKWARQNGAEAVYVMRPAGFAR